MEVEQLAIVVSAATTVVVGLGGVWLGWFLGKRTAAQAAASQRAWDEEQTVRLRKELAAEGLDAAIVTAMDTAPKGVESGKDAEEPLIAAYQCLREGWIKTAVLDDREIERRWAAVDMTLFMAIQDCRGRSDVSVNLYPISVAFAELRQAVVAYLQRAEPPPAQYPTSSELIQIAHPGGSNKGLEGVNDYLIEHQIVV